MNKLQKEVCGSCSKLVKIGQPTAVCKKCDLIFHGRCIKPNNVLVCRDSSIYCINCVIKYDIQAETKRYNPFFEIFNSEHSDKFYENEPIEFSESIEHISKTLEKCHQYSSNSFDVALGDLKLNNGSFSTFFLNLDGNKTNFDELVVNLSQLKHQFSVIGLAETNTDSTDKDLYQISDDYTSVYQSTSTDKQKGSGVGLYIHKKFNFSTLDSLSICNENIETLFVTLTNLEEPVTMGVIYRPPSGSTELFNEEFKSLMTKVPNKNSYILGDFNVNLLNPTGRHEQEFEEIMLGQLYPLISIATHVQPHCEGTCIDNILTSNSGDVMISGTLDWNISHHSPIFQVSEFPAGSPAKEESEKITIYYEYSKSNVAAFCDHLEETLAENHNTIQSVGSFIKTFKSSVDSTCKLSVPKITKRNPISNPWITPGLIRSMKKKDELYKIWKKSLKKKNLSCDSSLELYENYKSYRKSLKELIKLAKQNYYFSQFDKHKDNKKKTWEIINRLRGKDRNKIKACFSIDNERITCRRIIANKFNDYFVGLAKNLNISAYSDVPLASFPSFRAYFSKQCPSSIFLEDCDSEEVNKIISEFENGKASDIPIMLVKKASNIIAPTLVRLYNDCMTAGVFPDVLKIGKITPIHKKGNKELIENYRPVSTLPIFGKIFEKLIYSRLYDFFTSKGILSESQFGFRKGHSTSHAVHSSVNIIKEAHKTNKHVIGIFIDLSKAFDTLDHSILLDKLDNSGIRGTANDLIASYLSNRQQYTSILGESSDLRDILFGVPQGSVLGPLLFLLYINDLLNCYKSTDCKFVLYADDTNLFIIAETREKAMVKANKILVDVNNFMKSNLLHINIGKCCFMYFEPPSLYRTRMRQKGASCARTRPYIRNIDMPASADIKIDGHVIEEVTETKFLGVTIDDRLTWTPHIDLLHKKLRSATGILNRIKGNIPKENFKSLYHALFESHMSYCLTVFGGVGSTQLEKLFRVQKHCMRILFGDYKAFLDKSKTCARAREFGNQVLGPAFYCKEHTKHLFHQNKILALKNIYNYQCCLEILKILKFRLPACLYDLLNISQRNNGIRLILPSLSGDFIYNGSKLWNTATQVLSIDSDLYSIRLGPFKNKLKNILQGIQNKFGKDEWHPYNFNLDTALQQ